MMKDWSQHNPFPLMWESREFRCDIVADCNINPYCFQPSLWGFDNPAAPCNLQLYQVVHWFEFSYYISLPSAAHLEPLCDHCLPCRTSHNKKIFQRTCAKQVPINNLFWFSACSKTEPKGLISDLFCSRQTLHLTNEHRQQIVSISSVFPSKNTFRFQAVHSFTGILHDCVTKSISKRPTLSFEPSRNPANCLGLQSVERDLPRTDNCVQIGLPI